MALRALATLAAAVAALAGPPGVASAEEQVIAARVWPARDYSRVALESKREIKYSVFIVEDPKRLVLDLEDVEMGPILAELDKKVSDADPYIKGLRAALNRPGVVRVVVDLKAEVVPQVFTLRPIADYGHRLVIDLYPTVEPDPLLALFAPREPDRGAKESPPGAKAPRGRAPKEGAARMATIVIDAGHGGEDPGARGRRGTREKDVTLLIARRLKALVDTEPGMRAVLTRDGDYYLRLDQRVAKARKVRADLFVSIHADAFVRPHARGSSVFALSERRATSVAAEWLAKRENEADLVGGMNVDVQDPYLKRTLADLTVTGNIDHSLKLGGEVLRELGRINTLHKDYVEQAGFAVLKTANVPSILVETAFISNPEEEKKLKSRAYQDRMARALLAGIKRYLAKHPPRTQPTLALN